MSIVASTWLSLIVGRSVMNLSACRRAVRACANAPTEACLSHAAQPAIRAAQRTPKAIARETADQVGLLRCVLGVCACRSIATSAALRGMDSICTRRPDVLAARPRSHAKRQGRVSDDAAKRTVSHYLTTATRMLTSCDDSITPARSICSTLGAPSSS